MTICSNLLSNVIRSQVTEYGVLNALKCMYNICV